jgi:predicted DNA-binding transcriptional regulator YafY
VFDQQVDYVRSLPMHASQKEIETGEGYAIFEYRICPSFDFVQHLLWNKKVEVLSPLSLREEMKKELEEMLGRYQ